MAMPRISVVPYNGGDRIGAACPYHPESVRLFKKLNGQFDGGVWLFDARDEELVREILIDVYGTDDSDSCEDRVDIRIHVMEPYSERCQAVFLAGRQIARAFGRDTGARLGEGVVVVQGDEPDSGGSMRNWTTVLPADSVLEVRDVPRRAAEKLIANPPEELTISVVGQKSPDLEALKARREQLLDELVEVNEMIAGHEKEV